MKIEKRDGSDERRILMGMLTDQTVLARVAAIWKDGSFASPDSNLIGKWCVTHYEKYGTPPKDGIEAAFTAWASDRKNKKRVESVERLLGSLAYEYDRLAKEINSQHVLDIAARYFDRVRLRRLSEEIEGLLDNGEVDKAADAVSEFGRASISTNDTINVLDDEAALQEAFESKTEPLIKYPGALKNFFSDSLERDGFIAILAPAKRGKTFWLFDIAWRAMLQRRRVALFQCGDLSRPQMMRRIAARSMLRPLIAQTVQYPISIERKKVKPADRLIKAGCSVEFEERVYEDNVEWQQVRERFKMIREKKLADGGDNLKLTCAPTNSMSANDIRGRLRQWDRDGWAPDVVVVDYADILAPSKYNRESRDSINETWMRLRAISQEFHCLLVTATQADTAGMDAMLLRGRNFSDDRRKWDHITGCFAINQTEPEKKLDVTRVNWLRLRERESSEHRVVYVAGCRPCNYISVKSVSDRPKKREK